MLDGSVSMTMTDGASVVADVGDTLGLDVGMFEGEYVG